MGRCRRGGSAGGGPPRSRPFWGIDCERASFLSCAIEVCRMGKTYTTTIKLRFIKEHTCACCGGVFAYPIARQVKGVGGNAAVAAAKAEKAVGRTLQRDVDLHPCP